MYDMKIGLLGGRVIILLLLLKKQRL